MPHLGGERALNGLSKQTVSIRFTLVWFCPHAWRFSGSRLKLSQTYMSASKITPGVRRKVFQANEFVLVCNIGVWKIHRKVIAVAIIELIVMRQIVLENHADEYAAFGKQSRDLDFRLQPLDACKKRRYRSVL